MAGPTEQLELTLELTAADLAPGEFLVEIDRAALVPPRCRACADTGQVVPDAFGDWVPWLAYTLQLEALHRARGWPAGSSAIEAGLIRPMACPECCAKPTETAPC